MAIDFETYKDYCANRSAKGLQVIPKSLWNALKETCDANR
jgi:hypothetical protein